MKRLTRKTHESDMWFVDNHMGNIEYAGLFYIGKAIDKLAAYEDLGTVEELAGLKMRLEEKSQQFAYECGVVEQLQKETQILRRALEMASVEVITRENHYSYNTTDEVVTDFLQQAERELKEGAE